MKLNLETRYNVFDELEYKYIDTWVVFEGKEPKEEIKRSEVSCIEIRVGQSGDISVWYGMENDDLVYSDCVVRCLNE